MGSSLSHPLSIEFPKVITYQNSNLALSRHFLRFIAFGFTIWILIWERNFLEDAEPFGSINFSTPNDYTVDTTTLDYCSSSIIDNCTILEPSEALVGSSTEGTLFVNTMVKYTAETCNSCSATATGWIAPVSSASTSSLYTATKTNTYFVGMIEDYEVAVQHGGMVKWGYSKAAEYFGTVKTMKGALLGNGGDSVVKKFSSSTAYDLFTVEELLQAAGKKMCTGSDCDSTDIRYTGGTLLVELRYKNRIGRMVPEINEDMDYYYHCMWLPSLEANTPTDVYPDMSQPYGYSRVKVQRTGITVAFSLNGGISRFDFAKGWVYLAAGCFMFVIVDYLFQLILLCLCSNNLRHKLNTAKHAATEVFIYSSSAHTRKDGSYSHPSAKSMLVPEVEMSDYQRKKTVQRKISRTGSDTNEDFGRAPIFRQDSKTGGNGGGSMDSGGWESGNGGGGGGSHLSVNSRKPVPIGTKIRREFPGYGFFEGTVVDYKKPFYRVVYPDGDSEQLLGKELRPLILAQYL